MKILVTGGQGFIGHNLIKRLYDTLENVTIVSVDNLSTGTADNVWNLPNVEYCTYDIAYEPLQDLDFIPDVIFHMAATARIQPSFDSPTEVIYNNVESTINVLEFARSNNQIPVIFAGSSSVHSGHYKNPYTFSKWLSESSCKLYSELYQVPTTICRFYNVYGPNMISGDSEYATVLSIFDDRIKRDEPIEITSDGEQRRDFTHVDDICDGLIACIGRTDDRATEFEFGRGENYSINEIVRMFIGDDLYPVKYVAERRGEARNTLTLSERARKELGYNPTKNVSDYIDTLDSL